MRTVSERCCQTCNGTVFPIDTVMSTTQLEDDCLTTQTDVCRVRPGLETAVIEQEFSYRNCCIEKSKSIVADKSWAIINNILATVHHLGSSVVDPRTCCTRLCQYDQAWPHAVWLSRKEEEGCDCCQRPNGKMVEHRPKNSFPFHS